MNSKVIRFLRLNIVLISALALLIPLYFVLYKIYIPRINAFGCFDDCNNFMGGYFMLAGKHIFSDFFFNHQPFAAYLSYIIQLASSPQNIFELILRHRQFVMLFGLVMNAFLIVRFKLPALLFVLVYELSKFYLFGDRFLAEGIIVYPLAYMAGLAFLKVSNRTLVSSDYYLVSIFTWFVIFMREPYVPLAIALFAIILFGKKPGLTQVRSLLVFLFLSTITLFTVNIPEYFFNVVTVNYQAVLPSDIKAAMWGNRYVQAIFYPFYIFIYGNWNILHQLLAFLDIVFLLNIMVLLRNKSYKTAIGVFTLLGLANIRVVMPGALFYEAFHMLVWYGLFIFTTALLVFANIKHRVVFHVSIFLFFLAIFLHVNSPSFFPKENFDQHSQLLENFGEVMQQGEVVKALSSPGDTLFLDASDDMIYWQAKLPSPYKYVWYTSAMPHFEKYTDARTEMFQNNPPTFYKEYGSCPKIGDVGPNYRLPEFIQDRYVRLYNLDKPSCLFVLRDKIRGITDSQWKKALESLYHLP